MFRLLIRMQLLITQPTDQDDSINQTTYQDVLTNRSTDEDVLTNASSQCDHKCFIFFVEVVSNSDFIGTVRKLYFDLTLQLIHVRSYNNTVTSVKGLVVPSMTDKSKIELGTVTWNPDKFQFAANLSCVTKEDIESRLGGIIEQQWRSVHSGGPVRNDKILFVNSLTPDDARAYLSMQHITLTQDDYIEYFVPSVFAIVFSVGTKAYKFPLIHNDLAAISFLYSRMNFDQVLIPEGVSIKAYRFDLLTRPLEISEILQLCLNSFANSVFNAINQLHTLKALAHLDIRRPNICFRNGQAVLSDVDNLSGQPPEYMKSIMYSRLFDDASNYDWRQYAIMLARILENNESLYHTQPPIFSNAQSGQELTTLETGLLFPD